LSTVQGLRLAEAGEFTKRALFNGKLDLTEVEALADLLDADTEAQRVQALQQLNGTLRRLYERWREELTRYLSHAEACLDFGDDEDIDPSVLIAIRKSVCALLREIDSHLEDGRRGEIVRDGVSAVIVGRVNAGKSSLLNALAKREVALVSAEAGTTRDVVETVLDVRGYKLRIADTAGLRLGDAELAKACDIEQRGIALARERMRGAHLLVLVLDAARASVAADAAELAANLMLGASRPRVIAVLNKSDLGRAPHASVAAVRTALADVGHIVRAVEVSCVTGEGLDVLMRELGECAAELAQSSGVTEAPVISRARHREQLVKCRERLREFLEHNGMADIGAEQLRQATVALGKITGHVGVEELLDVIFRDFCIGK
jgi:tRNA modification GTPase